MAAPLGADRTQVPQALVLQTTLAVRLVADPKPL